MNLLTAENLIKTYGEKELFNISSLGIDEYEKIGLIGVNGTGKTTLLKIIAGVESSDRGKVTVRNNVHIEYLHQEPHFYDQDTVIQQVFKGDSPLMKLLRDYESTLEKVNNAPGDAVLEKKLISLSQEMDKTDAWQLDSEAKTILTRLGIFDFEAKVGTLSGGQRKRVALAGVLISPADLLVLDEPTNHIDNETVDWLEEYLNKRKGALLMVTHDRYFLDRVANRIIELDSGKIYSYTGNYTDFLKKKAEREAEEQSARKSLRNLFRNELAWIQRGAKARSTKQKARVERFEKLKETQTELSSDKLEITAGVARLGKKVIELEHAGVGFNGRKLVRDFSCIVTRTDRIGIIGPNGIGKTTLLKLMAGMITPDTGKADIGQTVKPGFFAQENREMDPEQKVIDYIREEAEFISTGDGGTLSASQMLDRFLFPPRMQWTPVGRISGGEKRRLYLLRVLMGAPNVLLFDEPTNDLDIKTLTILEEYLDEFPGAVIAVSHDRYFLDKVVNRIFAFLENGSIETYVGNYLEYLEYKNARTGGKIKLTEKRKDSREKEKKPVIKFSFKEQKEYEEIDEIIADLENGLKELDREISQALSDYTRLQELLSLKQEKERELDEKMERWTYLNELAEEIARSKNR